MYSVAVFLHTAPNPMAANTFCIVFVVYLRVTFNLQSQTSSRALFY